MFPIVQIGPLAVQVPGLLLLLGVWVGLRLAEREAARLGDGTEAVEARAVNADAIYNLALAAIAAGLVGARLAHAARYWQAYLADPLGLISPSPATLAAPEGVLIGLAAAAWYGRRKGLRAGPTLDALAPAAAVMGIALALAHMASGDAFGAPTSVPWRIYLWDDYRHPSQVYELLGALAVLGVWRWQRGRLPAGTGAAMLLVVAASAALRVFLEAFRGDSVVLAGGVRAAQAAGLAVLGATWWLIRRGRARGDASRPRS
jgi:prolipoprotein diacylglyceryltransferase